MPDPQAGFIHHLLARRPDRSLPGFGGQMESMRLSGPSALASAVPYLLGFSPERSLVLILSGSASGRVELTLRVDLPTPTDPPGVFLLDVLARTHHVDADRIVALVYDDLDSERPTASRAGLIAELTALLAGQQRQLVDALFVAQDRWWSFLCADSDCCSPAGNPIGDSAGWAAAAEAVGRGLSVAGSRAEFSAGLLPNLPGLATSVSAVVQRLSVPKFGEPGWAAWRDLAERHFLSAAATDAEPRDLPPEELAELVVALSDFRVRDPLLWHLAHESATAVRAVRLLATLAATAPAYLQAPPATMLAVCHWQAGNGAAAASLLDDVAPDYSLGRLLRRALDVGLPPTKWTEMLRGLDLAGCRSGLAA